MADLAPDQLAFLRRFAFDSELFASWRHAVRDGTLSIDRNKVRGTLHAPSSEQVHALPKMGSPERDALRAVGRDAIRRGEYGVVVLNGGMATRFGGVVKGVVEVLPGRSFLGLKMQDIRRAEDECGGRIPVFLMNSFATAEATAAHFAEHGSFGLDPAQVTHFTQFVSVRMTADGDVFHDDAGGISPYGPGHGDFAPALRHCGALQRFLDGGGKYLFLCNVDNLGARVSPAILGHHLRSRAQVTVEVAPKWPGDAGGSPYLYQGKLQLIEQIRYPAGFDPDIVDVFNTNTFTFDAEALDRDFELGWYYVEKTVDGRKAVQVERLVGELTRFLRADFLRVKRTGAESRFLPIKTPDDLESARDEILAIYDR